MSKKKMENNFNAIPNDLRQHKFWCGWRYNGDKKLPINLQTGGYAKSNDATTFSSFQIAYQAYLAGGYDGLGIGIFDDIGAIDIDNCVENGVLSDMAQDIIARMNSYTEYSPSGNGIRIIFKIDDDFRYDKDLYYISNQKLGLEIYISGSTHKFVTITGNRINDNPVANATVKLKEVLEMYMQRKNYKQVSETNVNPLFTDMDYLLIGLEKDNKLKSIWYGDRTKKSESECDAGLMSKLMYWLNNNKEQAIAAFLSSPYTSQKDDAHKKKLERSDYLPNIAEKMNASRTAAEDNEKWLKGRSIKQEITENRPQKLNVISAPDLQEADLPPVEFLVDDFLSMGAIILAGPPKDGKSWFVLLLAIKIALGKPFLRWQTKQAGVLYLAFEDRKERLQQRMNKLLNYAPAPPWLHFSTDVVTLEDGLLEVLDEHIKERPETKLIIIDTFQKIRGQSVSGERWYGHDYREAGAIKEFADKKGIAVIFVTHTIKSKDKDNPINELSGTNGIAGVMDTILILKKLRSAQKSVLYTTGRDIDGGEFALQFNKDTCQWEFVSDAEDLAKQEAMLNYQTNLIVKTIKKMLDRRFDNTWKGNASALMREGELYFEVPIALSPQALAKELRGFKDLLLENDNILYTISPNGNAGVLHNFRKR